MIIDCSMNLPLIYWAYEVTGNKQYYDISYNHITKASKYIVRTDGSTFHTFYMDVDTGEPKFGKTSQGFSDKSCWSRGQACGLLELSKHITFDDKSKEIYENGALLMIKSLIDSYTTINQKNSNGILLHGVYGKPLGNGIDECCIFGDYFYFEALVRVYKDWKPYW